MQEKELGARIQEPGGLLVGEAPARPVTVREEVDDLMPKRFATPIRAPSRGPALNHGGSPVATRR
jgi:hypothetical protein